MSNTLPCPQQTRCCASGRDPESLSMRDGAGVPAATPSCSRERERGTGRCWGKGCAPPSSAWHTGPCHAAARPAGSLYRAGRLKIRLEKLQLFKTQAALTFRSNYLWAHAEHRQMDGHSLLGTCPQPRRGAHPTWPHPALSPAACLRPFLQMAASCARFCLANAHPRAHLVAAEGL